MKKITSMDFSKEELIFLKSHGIELTAVFDGTGVSTRDRKAHSKSSGQNFLIGNPCGKGGHRLKTPNSDCIQCNPAVIAYKRRYRQKMNIYIAHTALGGVSKIGITQNIPDRHRQMNEQKYGGFMDWELFYESISERAGELESATLKTLSSKRTFGSYFKDGKNQEAKEMFSLPPNLVLNALKSSAKLLKISIKK